VAPLTVVVVVLVLVAAVGDFEQPGRNKAIAKPAPAMVRDVVNAIAISVSQDVG
jgi:hypothetical protein